MNATYTSTFNGLSHEEYYIVDKNKKVIDTRRIVNGYLDEELKEMYDMKSMSEQAFSNVEIRGKTLIYNEVFRNGENIDTLINKLKNETTYSNLIIKEI